jgi:hypothetical protein
MDALLHNKIIFRYKGCSMVPLAARYTSGALSALLLSGSSRRESQKSFQRPHQYTPYTSIQNQQSPSQLSMVLQGRYTSEKR